MIFYQIIMPVYKSKSKNIQTLPKDLKETVILSQDQIIQAIIQ